MLLFWKSSLFLFFFLLLRRVPDVLNSCHCSTLFLLSQSDLNDSCFVFPWTRYQLIRSWWCACAYGVICFCCAGFDSWNVDQRWWFTNTQWLWVIQWRVCGFTVCFVYPRHQLNLGTSFALKVQLDLVIGHFIGKSHSSMNYAENTDLFLRFSPNASSSNVVRHTVGSSEKETWWIQNDF